jgi:WD40 repeat protein
VGVKRIAISSDGRFLAAQRDNEVLLFGLKGQSDAKPLSRPPETPSAIATSATEPLIAVSFNKWIELWDLNTLKKIRGFDGHFRRIQALAFSADGKRLASSGDDQEIRIWDVNTGECLATIVGPQAAVQDISWCAGGATLASVDVNGHVCLWDTRTRQPILKRTMNAEGSVRFRPDGQTLLLFRNHKKNQIEILRAPRPMPENVTSEI